MTPPKATRRGYVRTLQANATDAERAEAAARASFDEDHRLDSRSWGRGRSGSIPKSQGAEGRNFVD
jgi:hypothetical protein